MTATDISTLLMRAAVACWAMAFSLDSFAATLPVYFSYNFESQEWTQLAGVPSETFKNAISAAGNTQAARDAKKAQDDASKAQSAATSAATDRREQIGIADEAARKANSDAAQVRYDLALARADAARESAAIRSSQNSVIYGQYLVTVLVAIVGALGVWMNAKLNKHMIATAEQSVILGRVDTNAAALVKALKEAHDQGKDEGAAEEKAKK